MKHDDHKRSYKEQKRKMNVMNDTKNKEKSMPS